MKYSNTIAASREALASLFDDAQGILYRLRNVEAHDLPTAGQTRAAAAALALAAQSFHVAAFALLDACSAFDGKLSQPLTETEDEDEAESED